MVVAMMTHYELKPTGSHAQPWVFDWDADTGEISGPDAQRILDLAGYGSIEAHPTPWVWTFSANPLQDKTDMAAILGFDHELPADLADAYPQWSGNGAPDVSFTDETGVFVIGNDQLVY